jgi:DNA-binding CsgD family transcriptional regulator
VLPPAYFELALKIHHASDFGCLASLLTGDLPALIGGDEGLVFVIRHDDKVEEVHGSTDFAKEAKRKMERINELFSIHPLAAKIDFSNPGELGLSFRQYVTREEYQGSKFLQEVHQGRGMEDGLFGLLAHGNGRTTMVMIIRHVGAFSPEERQIFDALLLTSRLVADLIARQNVQNQVKCFYTQHSPRSAQALFLLKDGKELLPYNHCAVRLSEAAWSEDQPVFRLSPEDQEALAMCLEKAWSDPLCTCFGEVEIDLGEGRKKVSALYGGETETWLILCLADERQAAEDAIQAMLTRRQREIMEWIAEGKTSAETAIILDISPRTVEKHLEAVFQRLGVENRITAVRRYLEMKSGQLV